MFFQSRGIGATTLGRKYAFKCREGFNRKNLRIPKRIFETPSPLGMISESQVRETVERMHKKLRPLSRPKGK